MGVFQAEDWYWLIGDDESRVYSSKKDKYVSTADLDYAMWLSLGNAPSTAASEAEFVAYMGESFPYVAISLPVALIAYANAKQWELASGGYVATIDGKPIGFSTSSDAMGLMNGKVARLSQPNPPKIINWQTGPTTLTPISAEEFAKAATEIADWVQSMFDLLPGIFEKIASGAITSRAQIDAELGVKQ